MKSKKEDMISRAGISIYLFGNKKQGGEIVNANVVNTEFDIAETGNHIVIPVRCTGYMANELWKKVNSNIKHYYGNIDTKITESFQSINIRESNKKMVSNIITLIQLLRR